MNRKFLRILIASMLLSGMFSFVALQRLSAEEVIKEYTPNISQEEYEKRYNKAFGEFTKKMAEDGNPAEMLLDDGKDLFHKADGSNGKSCASCHSQNGEKLKGAATTYPKYDHALKGIKTFAMQINICRERHMGAKPMKYDSSEQLALEIYTKSLSNGMPINVSIDGPAREFFEAGKRFYYTRKGQWNFSCALCHVKYAGHMLRVNLLSINRYHATHWPSYRLEWAGTGSLQKRIQGCVKNMRADISELQSEEYRNVELYLSYKSNGLPIQVPGFRM